MTKLRKSAKGETCTIRIPGVCNFDPETTVLAHAPCRDKGMGIKGPDWWAAYACSGCHDFLDGRNPVALEFSDFGLCGYWLPAIYETQKRMREKGLL